MLQRPGREEVLSLNPVVGDAEGGQGGGEQHRGLQRAEFGELGGADDLP
jgi:hypothetical protein